MQIVHNIVCLLRDKQGAMLQVNSSSQAVSGGMYSQHEYEYISLTFNWRLHII